MKYLSVFYKPGHVACAFFKSSKAELMAMGIWESDIATGDIDWQSVIDCTIESHGLDKITINGIQFLDLKEHPIYADIQRFSKRNIELVPPFDRLRGLIAYNNKADRLRFSPQFGPTAKVKEILNRDHDFTDNASVMAFLQGLKYEPQKKEFFFGGMARTPSGATVSSF